VPDTLLAQLQDAAKGPQAASWAGRVVDQIQQLAHCDMNESARISALLASLSKAVGEANAIAAATTSQERQGSVLRAAHGLSRRLALWETASRMSGVAALGGTQEGQSKSDSDPEEGRRRSRRVANLLSPRTDPRHHEGARSEPAVADPLPPSARTTEISISETPKPDHRDEMFRLIKLIEQYECTRTVSDARTTMALLRTLESSANSTVRQAATGAMETYRAPNLRIVVTEKMTNRVVPQPAPQENQVCDTIQGADVCGISNVFTTLRTHLVPDPKRLHLLLVADGVVDSQTSADAGSAVFENEGRTSFQSWGGVMISSTGVRMSKVWAEANAENDVVGVSTYLSGIPLLSELAKNRALKRQGQQEWAAMREVEEKVVDAAKERFVKELHPRVEENASRFQEKVWQPLVRLDLHPTPAEMYTTRERMVIRVLARDDKQLAAHTPRPRAPSDSLASMQIHESLLNNALANLKLDGQSMSLPELYRRVTKELNGQAQQPPETLPGNVRMRFAAQDAVRVRFTDGHVELVLLLDEVRKGPDRWHNLMVKAYYAPEGIGLDARLVRTETIELKGEDLSTGSQIALRGAFAKLLSRSRTVALVPQKLAEDKRLKDLEVTQFEVTDGWIGVAIGPGNVPGRSVKRCRPRTAGEDDSALLRLGSGVLR
jgi:hypothetical protein